MTKEESIKICKQVQKYFKGGKLTTDDTDAICEALTNAIEALKATQWISVSERLPDKDFTDCLVQIGHGEYALYETAYRVRGRWVFYSDRIDGEGQSVIAWMECPSPYKGE